RHVLGQHLGVVGRLLARGVGVQMTADRLDLDGDVSRGAPLRALEGHMLQQMRDAVDLLRLVARADPSPDAERDGIDRRHRVGGDAQAVVQRGYTHLIVSLVVAVHAPPLKRRSRMNACTTLRSLGRMLARSARLNRSLSRGGSGGRIPVACSTASGNFAGWAVASATIGTAPLR